MNTSPSLDELRKVLNVDQLPAMPHSALSVLQLDNDVTKVNISDLVRPIESDPGLAVQVLKFLNSSYFGFQSMITNIKQGIALVGIRIVKNFVLWKAVFSLIPKSKYVGFDVGVLWQDSLRRAMFARFMLLEMKKGDPEIAFAGALLQDMAIPLLIKQRPEAYGEVMNKSSQTPTTRLSSLEQTTFGWDHADAAGILGRSWKLPDPLVTIVENHLNIEEAVNNFEQHYEQSIVALSAFLPVAKYPEWDEKGAFLAHFNAIFPGKIQLLLAIFSKVDQEYEQYASILQLAKPKVSMMEYWEN